MTGIIDGNSDRFATWAYDVFGRAISGEHGGGVDQYTIDYSPKMSAVTEPSGHIRNYTFNNDFFDMIKPESIDSGCSTCNQKNSDFTYDSSGFLETTTDLNGTETNYIYNSRGLETSRTEAVLSSEERTIDTQWHPIFHLPTLITEQNKTTGFSYDGEGRLITRTETDIASSTSRTWQYAYTTTGLLESINPPRTDINDTATYNYDAQGNLSSITNALSHTVTFSNYDAHGRPQTLVDANGVTTQLIYDLLGRVRSTSIQGRATLVDYDNAGNLTQLTYPDGVYVQMSYDSAHRLTGYRDNLNNRVDFVLDQAGNQTQENVYQPDNTLVKTKTRVFNTLNELIEIRNSAGLATTLFYDSNGNISQVIDPMTNSTDYLSDALNRINTVMDAMGAITTLAYDSA